MTPDPEFNKSSWLKDHLCPFCGEYESTVVINSYPHTAKPDNSYVVERQCNICAKIFTVIYDIVDCESLE